MLDPTQRRQVGVFLPNAAPGNIPSTAATRNPLTFGELRRQTTECQQAGIDFVLMMSKLRGFGGETGFWDASLDAMAIAAGLLATVPDIGVVPTVATHSMHASAIGRQLAAFESISPGRTAINLAAGWASREFAQSGLLDVSVEAARATQADALAVLRLLLEGSGDVPSEYAGALVRLFDGGLNPRPIVPPALMVPGASESTLELASEHADLLLTSGPNAVERAASLQVSARRKGREVGTVIVRTVIPATSAVIARRRLEEINDATDWQALRALHAAAGPRPTGNRLRIQTKQAAIDPETAIAGTPADIAEHISILLDAEGVVGVCAQLDNYEDDLRLFCSDVMPLVNGRAGQGRDRL